MSLRTNLKRFRTYKTIPTQAQLAEFVDSVLMLDESSGGGGGSTWFDGIGSPSSLLGIDGDYYLNTFNGDVYSKASGAWSIIGNIKGADGAGGADGYYGSFYDMTDQPLSSTTTAQVVAIGSVSEANGVTIVGGNQITFAHEGTYSFTFSIQITNLANSVEKAIFWLKTNGADYPDSATEIDLQARKGAGNPNRAVITINYVATAAAGQNVQIYWSGSSTDLMIESLPAGTSPVSPAVPSIIVTAVQVMHTQLGPTGATGPSGPTGPSGDDGAAGRLFKYFNFI